MQASDSESAEENVKEQVELAGSVTEKSPQPVINACGVCKLRTVISRLSKLATAISDVTALEANLKEIEDAADCSCHSTYHSGLNLY